MPSSHADLLKVKPDAKLAEIKQAYRKAALAHHPDHNPHPDAARHFRRITEAYRVLEARAVLREPPRAKRQVPRAERVAFILADIASLKKRWPPERWEIIVDGLPASVWVVGILDVLSGQPSEEAVNAAEKRLKALVRPKRG